MAKVPTKEIEAVLFAAARQKLEDANLEKGVKAMARETINVIRERTTQGYDVHGKRLRKLSRKYREYKGKVVRGSKKLVTRKGASKKFKYPGKTTKFKAKSVPNHGRLTGNMFFQFQQRDAKARISGGSNSLKIKISYKIINNRKAGTEYLLDYYEGMGREIFGLSTKSSRRKKEVEKIIKAFEKATGLKINYSKSKF